MDFNFEIFLNQLSRELNKLKSSIFVGYFDEDDDGLFRALRAFHGGRGGGGGVEWVGSVFPYPKGNFSILVFLIPINNNNNNLY